MMSHEKLFGQLPTRLVIALVGNAAYNRAFDRNPFNFEHYNLIEIFTVFWLKVPPVLGWTAAVRYKTADD